MGDDSWASVFVEGWKSGGLEAWAKKRNTEFHGGGTEIRRVKI